MGAVAAVEISADVHVRDRCIAEELQRIGDVHGAAAEVALDPSELDGEVDAAVPRQARKNTGVGADVVDGERAGEQNPLGLRWRNGGCPVE